MQNLLAQGGRGGRDLMATKTGEPLSAAAGLLVKHLAGLSETDKGAERG
ncbi:hypothetical protein RA8CHR_00395 [Variovorax sp. RA8]|nr:hypothetical protein RA8CHR_00395 [Variovorax sp. RA8]